MLHRSPRPGNIRNAGSNPNYRLIVGMHSMSSVQFAACQTNCRFYYRDDNTPYITRTTPTVTSGGALMFGGRLRGLMATDYDITVDGRQCVLRNIYVLSDSDGVTVQASGRRRRQAVADNTDPITLTVGGSSDGVDTFDENTGAADVEERTVMTNRNSDRTEWCDLPDDLEAGLYNYTFNIATESSRWGQGDAQFSENLVLADFGGSQHVLTVAPVVQNLSTAVSGLNGGQSLLINGTGFNSHTCSANTVTVAGVACEVTWCTNTALRCTIGPSTNATTSPPYRGSLGLTRKIWYGRSTNLDFSNLGPANLVETVVGGLLGKTGLTGSYSQQIDGYFVAPKSANYSFWVSGDDMASFELDTNDGSGMQRIAYLNSYSTHFYGVDTQRSGNVFLTEGERYEIRAKQSETRGSDHLRVAVEVMDPGVPATFQYHRIGEKQRVLIAHDHAWQRQLVVLTNTARGALGIYTLNNDVRQVSLRPWGTFAVRVRDQVRNIYRTQCGNRINVGATRMTPDETVTITITWGCTGRVTRGGALRQWPTVRFHSGNLRNQQNQRVAQIASSIPQVAVMPLGGTFRLRLGSVRTPPIVYHPTNCHYTSQRIRAALMRNPAVHDLSVGCFGTTISSVGWNINFRTPHAADYPELVVITRDMTGNNIVSSAETIQDGRPGSKLFNPLPDFMTEVARDETIAQLEVNGIAGLCNDNAQSDSLCKLEYSADATPIVTGIAAAGGGSDVVHGDSLVIDGTGFGSSSGASATVSLGGSPCSVTGHTDTRITCDVRHATYGQYTPEVLISTTGFATIQPGQQIQYGYVVDSIGPLVSGFRGGALITISGTGFSIDGATNEVTIGGVACTVVSALHNTIICLSPAMPDLDDMSHGGDTVAAELVIGFFGYTHDVDVIYRWDHTPSVTLVAPLQYSAALTTTFTFRGPFGSAGFGAAAGSCVAAAALVSSSGITYECADLTVHPTNASCTVSRGSIFPVLEQPGIFPQLRLCNGDGVSAYAHPEPGFSAVDAALRIAGVFPRAGSVAGGANVVITGAGFVNESMTMTRSALTFNYFDSMAVVNITLVDRTVPCRVITSNFSAIECRTVMPTSRRAVITDAMPHTYTGGYAGFAVASINDFMVPGCAADFSEIGGTITYFSIAAGAWCNDDRSFCLSWAPLESDNLVSFTINGTSTSSLSLGLTDMTAAAAPADMTVCEVESDGSVSVEDRFLAAVGEAATLDSSQDVLLLAGDASNGVIGCNFVRRITAGSPHDRSVVPGVNHISWSLGGGANGTADVEGFFSVVLPSGGYDVASAPNHVFSARGEAAPLCAYDYSVAHTPTVSGVSPTTARGNTSLTIAGTGFLVTPAVDVGRHVCTVTSYTASQIVCSVPSLAAGRYFIRVAIAGRGLAAQESPVTFSSLLHFDTIFPRVSSLQGGLVTTITGSGFNLNASSNAVYVGGQAAHIIESTATELVIVTPVVANPSNAVQLNQTVVVSVDTEQLPDYSFGQVSPTHINYFDSSRILDPVESDRTYSSVHSNSAVGTGYSQSRLASPRCWAAARNVPGEWLTMDLGETRNVTGVVVAGRADYNQWLTRYTVSVSTDGTNFLPVPGTHQGSRNRYDQVESNFGQAYAARYVRIVVVSWYGHISFRAGVVVTGTPLSEDDTVHIPTTYAVTSASTTLVYQLARTPTITGVSPRSGFANTNLTISGTLLNLVGTTEVLVGGVECAVTLLQEQEIRCTLGLSPAGAHRVYVTAPHVGTARNTLGLTFTSHSSVSSLSVSAGSYGGGTVVTVTGRGFGGGESDEERRRRQSDGAWGGWYIYDLEQDDSGPPELGTKVSICGGECVVTNSSYTELVCETSAVATMESVATYKADEPTVLTPSTVITSNRDRATADRVFDNDFTTYWEGGWVGFDLGSNALALATKVRFFPRHQAASSTEGGVFEVSADNLYWLPLGWARNVHQGWNYLNLDHEVQMPWRYFRFRGRSSTAALTQLQVYGFNVSSSNQCAVTIHSTKPLTHPSLGPMETDHSIIYTNASGSPDFTYSVDNTGTVTGIEPKFGSSLGGETVTITGTGLPNTVGNTSVEINGVDCQVTAAASAGTSVQCVTAARGGYSDMRPVSLDVRDHRAGRGFAISNSSVRFRYLDRWSQRNTWLNDEPPGDGDTVVVPEDQTLLLDVQPPRLFALIVHGMMVFDRRDINLDASYILVQGGTLEIGTEDDPFLNTTTITLHGDRRRSVELPFVGAKMLAVADKGGFTTHGQGRGAEVPLSQKGILDIHGKPRLRTWTKLAVGTLLNGTRTIITAEPTDFAPGEKIVITAPHQELTVANRTDAFNFSVVEPLAATHVSEIRHHVGEGGDFELDMRGEVALLSRNIIIQGAGGPRADGSATIAEDDEEEASTAQLFGVHTGAFHGGHYRVENTELRHCGQAGNLGRYCMHFHVNDENPAPNSYMKSNSIHHSFQRATVVHKTHRALVANNVAYHVMGHTFFIEEGDEMYNTFDNNIGIFTRPSHMMLKSDLGPATFWTAIPDNYWRNNVATDSSSRGAWFELKHQGETLEFRNNSFHHNSGIGFRNYPNYSPPSPQYFYNNSYFKNGGNGLFYKKGGDNHHVFSKFAENGVDIFWKKYHTHDDSRLIPNVHDCIFWGRGGASAPQAIFAPQHEFFYINGSTFIGYEDSGAMSACAGCCSQTTMRQGAYTVRSERLHWINSTKKTRWTCPFKQIFHDLDGSLTGYEGGTALPYYNFNEWDGHCARDVDAFASGWAGGGMVCNSSVRVRRLQIMDHLPRELDRKAISFKKSEITGVDENGTEIDRFGRVDWNKYHRTGALYEGDCLSGNHGDSWTELDFSGCDVQDHLDWINYRVCNSDFSGWAVPMVTHHDYYADVDWHIDFQRMKMRWSEPFYLTESYNRPLSSEVAEDPESVMIRWPYVDYRYRYRVNYAGDFNTGAEVQWYDDSFNRSELGDFSRADNFGAGFMIRQDDSLRTTACCGEWKVAMNPWAGVELDAASSVDPLVIGVNALQCAPTMCGLPGEIPSSWPAPLFWSDPATWVAVSQARINTVDITPTGRKPVAGESVEIPQGMFIIMDEDPPALDKVVVSGKLELNGNRDLHVNRMLVWGILEIGRRDQTYLGNVTVNLHGVRTSATLVATDQHFLGNKNLVVFGQMTAWGRPVASRWTTLNTTAGAGNTTLTLSDPVDWSPGDQVVISPTEYPQPVDVWAQDSDFSIGDYAAHEDEVRTIASVDGRTIVLTQPLANRHFSGVINTRRGSVELRAHVGLLTSNIKIRGAVEDTPVAGEGNWYQGYGGHIVVGEVNFGSEDQIREMQARGESLATVQKLGSLELDNVELQHMGKLASEHPAVLFKYFSDLDASQVPVNVIQNCAFNSAYNHAVSSVKSFGLNLTGNVVHKSFKSGIEVDIDSRNTTVNTNLVVGNQRSPDDYDPRCTLDSSCWNHPFAAFMLWNKHMVSVAGNVAAGAEDTGFIMYPLDACNATELIIHGNEAYAALVGGFLLDAGVSTCRKLVSFKAWKNAHIGIVTVDQSANIVLDGVHVADNHEGISLNFVRRGIESFSTITRSSIIGSSDASICTASTDCRATTMGDERGLGCNSEFGSSWRRVGLVMPQYTNLKKTCEGSGELDICNPPTTVFRMCSLPWENRFGNPDVQYANLTISDTDFAHWATTDCGLRSRAIALNPSQPDLAPETFLSNLSWFSVNGAAKFNLGDTTNMTHEATACGRSCDAVNYFQMKDLDGTTFTRGMARQLWNDMQPDEALSLHSDQNPPAVDPSKCQPHRQTGSIVCRDYALTRLVLESNPPRFVHRRVGPATIAKYGDDVADNRTFWSVGPFPQACSCQKHFAMFHFDTQGGQNYDIHTVGILEDTNRISYISDNATECILTKIFFSKPHPVEVVRISDDRVITPLLDGSYPSLDNDDHISGANVLDPQERMLHLKLCGGESKQFWLRYLARVQVTATLSMSYDEFFANAESGREYTEVFVRNIALLLGINPNQIRVVCIHRVGQPCTRERRTAFDTQSTPSPDQTTVIEFEVAPNTITTETVANGTITTNVSISDEDQMRQLSDIYNQLNSNSSGLVGGMNVAGSPVYGLTTNFSNVVSTTTTTSSTVTTGTTVTSTTETDTSTTTGTSTTGSRTSSTTTQTLTSSTVTTGTSTTASATTVTTATATFTAPNDIELASTSDTDESGISKIAVLAGVLGVVAVIIVIVGVVFVNRAGPKGVYDLNDRYASEQTPAPTTKATKKKLTAQPQMSGTIIMGASTVAETDVDAAANADDDVAVPFKASQFQDSLRIVPGKTTREDIQPEPQAPAPPITEDSTPIPAVNISATRVQSDNRSGGIFSLGGGLPGGGEAETEQDDELPNQFFGQRGDSDHTNMELNPAFFGRREAKITAIRPDFLEEEPDWEADDTDGGYLAVAGQGKAPDGDPRSKSYLASQDEEAKKFASADDC